MGDIGICKLCDKEKELKKSHAIPSSFIKTVLDDDGLAFTFDKNNNKNPKRVGNNLKGYLLCGGCENFLSKTYEHPFITLLKNGSIDKGKSSINKTPDGHVFKLESEKLSSVHVINFIISVFWRISLLNIDSFKDFNLPDSCLDWMKDIILKNKLPESRIIGIEINTLIDSSEKFPNDEVLNTVCPPFIFEISPPPNTTVTIAMFFGGYFFKMIMPNSIVSNQIKENTEIYLAENMEILSHPTIYDTLNLGGNPS